MASAAVDQDQVRPAAELPVFQAVQAAAQGFAQGGVIVGPIQLFQPELPILLAQRPCHPGKQSGWPPGLHRRYVRCHRPQCDGSAAPGGSGRPEAARLPPAPSARCRRAAYGGAGLPRRCSWPSAAAREPGPRDGLCSTQRPPAAARRKAIRAPWSGRLGRDEKSPAATAPHPDNAG